MFHFGHPATWSPKRQCSEVVVEDCARITAKDAVLPDGVERVILRVGAIWQPHLRCPRCGSARLALFAPQASEIACRRCHRLDYRSRHEHRDPVTKAAWLRQQLGAPAGIGAPLPPRPANRRELRRYNKLVLQLAQAESLALKAVRHMVQGVDRHARSEERRRAGARERG